MRVAFTLMAVLAVVVASGIPATAHHSNPLYFDMSKAVTLEGTVLCVGILHGRSPNNALREVGSMKERLKPGTPVSARVWPSRNPLFLNDAQTVLLTRPDDARQSSRIVGAGQIRFSNGDVLAFGGGPTF